MTKLRVIYEENNIEYTFSSIDFKREINAYIANKKKEGKFTQKELFDMIADKTNVSCEAVKQWYGSYNGPADIEIVKGIASVLGIEFKKLIVAREQEIKMEIHKEENHYNYSEKELIEEVYQRMYDFAKEYSDTAGGVYILSNPEIKDTTVIANHYIGLCDEIHAVIDRYALRISRDTRRKLQVLVMELKQNIVDPFMPNRWCDVNEYYHYAKRLLTYYATDNKYEGADNELDLTDVHAALLDDDCDMDLLFWLMARRTSEFDLHHVIKGEYGTVHFEKANKSELDISVNQFLHDQYESWSGLVEEGSTLARKYSCFTEGAVTSLRELYLNEFVETMKILFSQDFNLEV